MISLVFLSLCVSAMASASAPTGLLCDFQKHPALGVRAKPRFTWIVPPCSEGADHQQASYQLTVSSSGSQVWDSGKVVSNDSTYVEYAGPTLMAGTHYQWVVTTWTTPIGGGSSCQSSPSESATFITSLADWQSSQFISLPDNAAATFGYFRRVVSVPAGVVSATAFVTAAVATKLLSGYKLYINGELVALGPGRGEAPVWGGDGQFRNLPYATVDVTSHLSTPGKSAIALQVMHHTPSVIMQLQLRLQNGTVITVATDETWLAFNADVHRGPGKPQHGSSAGTVFLEYIDARHEPVGWKLPTFDVTADWSQAVAATPTADQLKNLHPKMEPPMQVTNLAVRSIRAVGPSTSFVADFGREFQGGLRLSVTNGQAGVTVHIACGESLDGDVVGFTWGWEFDWTLRDGAQQLEQHKYMECRYVSLVFSKAVEFTLSAWRVNYKWDEADTFFTSSNATLNAVWELSRYTLEAASLDTYTDSNTRERRPYEADGAISATARSLVQRDYLWARHSHAWMIEYPTWPVEWKQLTPFLGWQDYMATGQPDVALAFMEQMHERSQIKYLDSSGLLNTSAMGKHIVDWMPDGLERDETAKRGLFTQSDHTSVSNAFAAHGLDLLAQMMDAGGRQDNATQFAAESAKLMKAIVDQMWNGTAFCDGVCSEVEGHSLVMTNIMTLCFGMVPEEHVASVWGTVASWGMEQLGDYGAFWYLMALTGGPFAPSYDTPDDGSAVLTALTKCDEYSWCSGLRDDNLTMTRESWHNGTYSHEWGTGAIVGVVWGIMGVHQTSPGWATFTVKPKLGDLAHASITVPTIRGYINVTASADEVEVHVPCNSVATLCLPRSVQDGRAPLPPQSRRLLLDGSDVAAVTNGGHLCTSQGVSCGENGAPRRLSVGPAE